MTSSARARAPAQGSGARVLRLLQERPSSLYGAARPSVPAWTTLSRGQSDICSPNANPALRWRSLCQPAQPHLMVSLHGAVCACCAAGSQLPRQQAACGAARASAPRSAWARSYVGAPPARCGRHVTRCAGRPGAVGGGGGGVQGRQRGARARDLRGRAAQLPQAHGPLERLPGPGARPWPNPNPTSMHRPVSVHLDQAQRPSRPPWLAKSLSSIKELQLDWDFTGSDAVSLDVRPASA